MSGIRRNQSCPCGSGRKYKHCHGAFSSNGLPNIIQRDAERLLQLADAENIVRQTQQGFGKPIISFEVEGYRIVGVGSRLCHNRSDRWRFFTDFLLWHLKDTLGAEWGQSKQLENYDHPIFGWLARMETERRAQLGQGRAAVIRKDIGYLSSIFRLAYGLYQIEHNDKISPQLVGRLRDIRTFKSAAYETIVFSAFAVAGFRMQWAEVASATASSPEFWAVSASGKRYSVEAKRKSNWTSEININSTEFFDELRQWLRDQLHRSSKKELENAVFWFELSIPASLDEVSWMQIHQMVTDIVKEAESIKIRGFDSKPAYVFITNNAHLVDDDISNTSPVVFLVGYKITGLQFDQPVELEVAMHFRDVHREIMKVLECVTEVQRVPTTFDGTPSELLDSDGLPETTFRIGDLMEYSDSDSVAKVGQITNVVSTGDRATLVIKDIENDQSAIITIPLTSGEHSAAAQYGDVIFGDPSKKKRDTGDDPIKIYDWFLETYSTYNDAALLRQIATHPDIEKYKELSTEVLRTRVARELTKQLVISARKS